MHCKLVVEYWFCLVLVTLPDLNVCAPLTFDITVTFSFVSTLPFLFQYPYLISMILCLFGGIATSFLPETLGAKLPDNVKVKLRDLLLFWPHQDDVAVLSRRVSFSVSLNLSFSGLQQLWSVWQISILQTKETIVGYEPDKNIHLFEILLNDICLFSKHLNNGKICIAIGWEGDTLVVYWGDFLLKATWIFYQDECVFPPIGI